MKTTAIFCALDLDRCLLDSTAFQEMFTQYAEEKGVVARQRILHAQQATEATGGSFDTASYVRQQLKDSEWSNLKRSFLRQTQQLERQERLFLGRARAFLAELRHRSLPFGVVTYGGFEWQTMKLQALGLQSVPSSILLHPQKGQFISSFYRPERRVFVVPSELAGRELHVRTIFLIDDKAASFQDLPAQARGLWLVPDSSELILSQQGVVGENVQIVRELDVAYLDGEQEQ